MMRLTVWGQQFVVLSHYWRRSLRVNWNRRVENSWQAKGTVVAWTGWSKNSDRLPVCLLLLLLLLLLTADEKDWKQNWLTSVNPALVLELSGIFVLGYPSGIWMGSWALSFRVVTLQRSPPQLLTNITITLLQGWKKT